MAEPFGALPPIDKSFHKDSKTTVTWDGDARRVVLDIDPGIQYNKGRIVAHFSPLTGNTQVVGAALPTGSKEGTMAIHAGNIDEILAFLLFLRSRMAPEK